MSRVGVLCVGVLCLGVAVSAFAQGCGEVWTEVPLTDRGNELYCGVWANNQFVLGGNGLTMTSPDGWTWEVDAPGKYGWVTGIAYGAGRYVAAVSTDRAIYVSKNGHRWHKHFVEGGGWFQDVVFAKGHFVAVALHGHVWTSPDGLNWIRHDTGFGKHLTSIAYGSGRFVAVGVGDVIATSRDGATWHRRTPGHVGRVVVEGFAPRIAYGAAGFVIVDNDKVLHSPDGKTWARVDLPEDYGLESVTFTGSVYVAVGGAILTSVDGVQWTPQVTPAAHRLYGVVASGDTVLAIGSGDNGAEILMSTCSP